MKTELRIILIAAAIIALTNFVNYLATKSVWYNRGLIEMEKIWLNKVYTAPAETVYVRDTIPGPLQEYHGKVYAKDTVTILCNMESFSATIEPDTLTRIEITAYPEERSFVYDIYRKTLIPSLTQTITKYVPIQVQAKTKDFFVDLDAIYHHGHGMAAGTYIGWKFIKVGRIYFYKDYPATVVGIRYYF